MLKQIIASTEMGNLDSLGLQSSVRFFHPSKLRQNNLKFDVRKLYVPGFSELISSFFELRGPVFNVHSGMKNRKLQDLRA